MSEPTQIDAAGSPRLRSDAAANRRRILAAAKELFSERGLDVPMNAIARRAGVGAATLFRRFPDRESLVAEVFARQIDHCESVLAQAVADPDPWRGFCRFIAEIARMQIADRGFTEAFLSTQRTDAAVGDRRRGAEAEFADLVDRAKQTGMLRDDFVVGDLAMVMLANSGLGAAAKEHRMGLSQRLVAYLLFAFGTEAAWSQITLPPPNRMGIVDLYTAES
jgi:AcrR family transcriptional regulator